MMTLPGSPQGSGIENPVISAGSLRPRDRESRIARIGERIVEVVRLGPWRRRAPGVLAWYQVRGALGGSVRTPDFVEAVGLLMRAGRVVEVWHEAPPGAHIGHKIVLVGHRDSVQGEVYRVVGRRDRIEDEYADVLRRDLDIASLIGPYPGNRVRGPQDAPGATAGA